MYSICTPRLDIDLDKSFENAILVDDPLATCDKQYMIEKNEVLTNPALTPKVPTGDKQAQTLIIAPDWHFYSLRAIEMLIMLESIHLFGY